MPMIGIVTDSNAQLPRELIDRYGIEVVPLTVTVDGTPYAEGVDLDPDDFYARFEMGQPSISTSQPSPGRFTEAYAGMAERGAREVLSIHIGSQVSGTVNSARLAAANSPVPVRIVDSGTASFGVGCCVWAAADAIEQGAGVEDAAAVAAGLVSVIGNVFIVGALDLVRAGGRLAADVEDADEVGGAAVPILSLVDGEVRVVDTAGDVDEAVRAMARYVTSTGRNLNVAVGTADRAAAALSAALEAAVADDPHVREVIGYRIGPSVGAHTGPGTAGAFFFPVP